MKLRTIFITFLIFSVSFSFSQTNKTDSLKFLLKKDPNNLNLLLDYSYSLIYSNPDTVLKILQPLQSSKIKNNNPTVFYRAQAYMGTAYDFLDRNDSSLYFLRSAILGFRKIDSTFLAATVIFQLGQRLMANNSYKNALDTLNVALTIFNQQPLSLRKTQMAYQTHIIIGETYNYLGLYDEAIKQYDISNNIVQNNNSVKNTQQLYTSLGTVYNRLQKYQKAIEYYQNGYSRALIANDYFNSWVNLKNITIAYVRLNMFDSALANNNLENQFFQKLQPNSPNGTYWQQIADIKRLKKEYDSALYFAEKGIFAYNETKDSVGIAECKLLIVEVFLIQKKYILAKKLMLPIVTTFEKINASVELKDAYRKLISIDSATSNYESESLYWYKFDSVNNILSNESRNQSTIAQEIKYETSLKEATITTQQTEIKAKTQQRNWFIGGGIFALLAASGLGFLYNRTNKQKAIISNQNKELEQSNHVIEKQKKDILHFQKNANQLLYSMFNSQAENDLKKDNFKSNKERVFAMSLLHALLYEKQDNIISLKEYLEKLCAAKAEQNDVAIECNIVDEIPLKAEQIKDIGIIVNELITNSIKYAFVANAEKKVSVFAEKPNGELQLKVSDTGTGVSENILQKQYQNSFGLDYVNDLVAQYDGQIKTYNNNGANFEIILNLS